MRNIYRIFVMRDTQSYRNKLVLPKDKQINNGSV